MKIKEINILPTLRFSEFDADWKKKLIDEISTVVGGGTPDTTDKEYWNGDVVWFTPSEIKEKYLKDSVRKITELGVKKSSAKYLPINSLILSTRATVGDVGINKINCTTNQGFQNLIINQNIDHEYIYYWIIKNKKEFLKRSSGSTFPEISNKEVKKINVTLPSFDEQKKIAGFLGVVDERIDLLTQRLEKVKEYKKGVMQKIFNQEIRFRKEDGTNYPAWQEKKLGEVVKFKQGVQVPVQEQYLEYSDKVTRFIRIVDLTKNDEPVRYIKKPNSENIISKKDLFMVRYGSPGLMGLGYEGVIANNLFRLIPYNIDNISSKFLLYLLTLKKNKILSYSSSTTMPAISFSGLKLLKLNLPNKYEQEKIANFLSSIDTKIELMEKQLTETKNYKKSLLQQMLV